MLIMPSSSPPRPARSLLYFRINTPRADSNIDVIDCPG